MQFNSIQFLVFFPAVLAVYFFIPRKARYLWLLAASYVFYMGWNARYALLLAASTLATYFGALVIARIRRHETDGSNKKMKLALAVTLIINFSILAVFKYAGFIIDTINDILAWVSCPAKVGAINLLLPVGISFYIFQAVGYTIDVYRGKVEAESNLLRYALFVSFFPQLVAGPIERSSNLLPQLRNLESIDLWDSRRIQRGCLSMLGGYLMKMLIADRAAVIVEYIFGGYQQFSGAAFILAIIIFGAQIYCDFAGYSLIAIGAAQVMGIQLMENFHAPFFAPSIRDYWNRWHISLSTWFVDYLYIPLGGNRGGKRKKYRNLLIVFAVSGLWHGAAWNYVIWGVTQGIFRVTGEITTPFRKRIRTRLHIDENSRWLHFLQVAGTAALVTLGYIAFRSSESMNQMIYIAHEVFTAPLCTAGLIAENGLWLGMRTAEVLLLCLLIILLAVCDYVKDKGWSFAAWFERRPWLFRAGFFLFGILAILLFGVYGPGYDASTFIYFQF